ncbi:anaphase promoting complex subunit 4 [Dinochytrium kinnereticum]|nr:anaphase promoting complex subunit 4 [Dinochytrium kinnereticum]
MLADEPPTDAMELIDSYSFINPTSLCRWAPGYELLAALSITGELIGYRAKSNSRAWLIYRKNPGIEDFAWRPDGREIAVGFSDGSISLFSAETGQQIHKVHFDERRLGRISSLIWVDDGLGLPPTSSRLEKICHDPRCVEPHRQDPEGYTILIARDENMQINLRLQGFMDIGWTQAADLEDGQLPAVAVLGTSQTLNEFSVSFLQNDQLQIHSHNISFARKQREPLRKLARISLQIETLLSHLGTSTEKLETEDGKLTEFSNLQMTFLTNRLQAEGETNMSMLHYLSSGKISPALASYFCQDLTVKGLQKWKALIDSAHTSLKNLLKKTVLSNIEGLLSILSDLLGISSSMRGEVCDIGLSYESIKLVINTLTVASRMTTDYMEDLSDCFKSYKTFMEFLNNGIQLAAEPRAIHEVTTMPESSEAIGFWQAFLQGQHMTGRIQAFENMGNLIKMCSTLPKLFNAIFEGVREKMSIRILRKPVIRVPVPRFALGRDGVRLQLETAKVMRKCVNFYVVFAQDSPDG